MIAGSFLPDPNARFDLSLTNPEEIVDMALLRRYVVPSRPQLGLLIVARSMRTEVMEEKRIRKERKNGGMEQRDSASQPEIFWAGMNVVVVPEQ